MGGYPVGALQLAYSDVGVDEIVGRALVSLGDRAGGGGAPSPSMRRQACRSISDADGSIRQTATNSPRSRLALVA